MIAAQLEQRSILEQAQSYWRRGDRPGVFMQVRRAGDRRSWFRRGRHRPGPASQTVSELAAEVEALWWATVADHRRSLRRAWQPFLYLGEVKVDARLWLTGDEAEANAGGCTLTIDGDDGRTMIPALLPAIAGAGEWGDL